MLNLQPANLNEDKKYERMIVLEGQSPNVLDLNIPAELEAGEPPESRGLSRDMVRLMVSNYLTNDIQHTRFQNFPDFLSPGDVVVINTSGTLPAAVDGQRKDGAWLKVHFSTHLPGDLWTVELRNPNAGGTEPLHEATPGEIIALPGEAAVQILSPYQENPPHRLWLARFTLNTPLEEYLGFYGSPIRYNYVSGDWPIDYYQTVYAGENGSAEMPSAGRGFTPEIITRLVAKGVQVIPLVLHTGVSSQENHEPPYEEYYRVPVVTAGTINTARRSGKRIVAVGTTVVRALETVTDSEGITHPGEGWTSLVIQPGDRLYSVNCMLTGMHEPEATHISMLSALAGYPHVEISYREALNQRYLWHEFGDLHLLMP